MGMALSGCGYGEQTYHWCRTWESCPSSINGSFKSEYYCTTSLAAGIFYYSWYSNSIVTYNCNPSPWRCGISSIVEALKWQNITLCQKKKVCDFMHWMSLLYAVQLGDGWSRRTTFILLNEQDKIVFALYLSGPLSITDWHLQLLLSPHG